MANDLGFLKVWANANKKKQTTKRSLSEFLKEYDVELSSKGSSTDNVNYTSEVKPQTETKKTIKEQALDAGETVVDSAGYIGEKIVRGAIDGVEGITDFLWSIPLSVGWGLTSGFGLAKNSVSDKFDEWYREVNEDDITDYFGSAEGRYDAAPNKLKEYGWLPETVGNILPTTVEAYFSGGGSMVDDAVVVGKTMLDSAKAFLSKPMTHFGMSAAGSATEEAVKKGADPITATTYGTASGGLEVATEMLFGGLAGLGDDFFKVAKTATKTASKTATKTGSKTLLKKVWDSPITKKVLDISGEAVEEGIVTGLDPHLQRVTGVDKNAKVASFSDYVESGSHGIILSLAMNAIGLPIKKYGKAKVIKVINEEVERQNGFIADDNLKMKPLPKNATEEEIKNKRKELITVTLAFDNAVQKGVQNEQQISTKPETLKTTPAEQTTATETPTTEENSVTETPNVEQTTPVGVEQRNTFTEELDEIARTEMPSVGVGETYVDNSTGRTVKVVSRDDATTTVEITLGDKIETQTLSNKTADTLAVDDKYTKVGTTAETVAETTAQTDSISTEMYNMLVGEKLTNKAIDNIISTPELRSAFEQLTGLKIKGTKAEQRAVVRNAVEKLKSKATTTDTIAPQTPQATSSVKVGDVYVSDSKGATYTIVGRDAEKTIVSVKYNNGDTVTKTTSNAEFDNTFFKTDGIVKIEAKNTPTEVTPNSKEKVNVAEISLVVDAMNETLREGAEEEIYERIPKNLEKSLDIFADSLVGLYKQHHTIGSIANYFTDGGAKVIAAIESTLGKSNLDNKTIVETTQNTENVLKNQSESATITEKTTRTVPDADKSNTVAYTNDNQRIDLRYKVVSVDDLVVSNSLDGKVNPNYPQELQPRDRSRTSSQSQIRQMAANLNPARLEESTSVSEGSPIVGPDNVVESGNGRTLAIELAYKNGTADEYRNHIIRNADKYGLDTSNLPERPVLVRERITEVDRTEFTRKANESSIGSLSATEQAKVDAEKLTEDVLNLLVANDDGVINTSDNHNFISAVITKVFKNEDLNNVVGADGRLSARGLERITNAIFYKAYGDASLSARLSENLDNDMKNATKVLLNIAPRVVSIKNGIASGSIYDFDFSTDIVSAIKLFEKCRNQSTTLENYAAQESLFEKESKLVMQMAYVFETKNRGAKQATDFYNLLLDMVTELGNPNQISLDIIETFQTKGEILNATVENFNNRVEPKNAITIPENILESESGIGREVDGRGNDETQRNEPNKNEKTENAVGVQPDNRRGKETGVVANDEQLRQTNESIERQSEVEREDNGNERRSNSVSENSRRGNNGSTRKQTGRISYFERKNKGKNAKERKNFTRELIERGQAEEVVKKLGKNTYKYTLVKPEAYNDDMLSMVEEAKSRGVEIGFFIGNAKVNYDTKDAFLIDGIKINDSQILVQYDEDISPQKLFKHELLHAKWKTRTIQAIKNTILDNLSETDKKEILSRERMQRYQAIYKDDAGQPKMDIVWEEYVCDVMSGMVEDTAKYIDTVTDYWYGSEAVDGYKVSEYTESIDAGGKNTERYSLKWRTDLNQTQYKEVIKWLRQEGNPEEKRITDTAYWYKGRISGDDLVVIYSTQDATPTILYERKGAEAKLELDILQKILEVIENGESNIGIQRNIDRLLSVDWVQEKHNLANNNDRLGERGSDTGYASILQGESPQFIGSPAFRNVIKNLFDIQNESVRFSLKDSNGNTLSNEQVEYFKDSKVRDESGNLLVMYQGSADDFTVFDRKKSNYANLYGRGFYFTKSENHASQYGNTRAYYLNIKHPVSTTETTITQEQLRKFLQAVAENEDYSFENYGYDATVDSVLQSTYGKSDFLMLNDVSQTAIGDLVETVELFNEVNGTDYDGIMLATETVTFNSEQAKLTSNEKPTSNPDIRFSLAQPVEETKNLIAVHNMQVSELERTLDLGGLPMPSIAIIKAQNGHSEYGDVSLVFDKQTIDPKASKSNKVYGGDAWTPTYPTIEYKPNEKIANKISDKYYELSRKFGYDESRPLYNYVYDLERILNTNKGETEMINELYDNTDLMQLYLLDSGENKVETIKKETRTELTDAEIEMNEFFIKELGADVVDEVMFDGNGTPIAYRKNYMSKYEDAIRETYKKLLSEVYQFSDEQVQNVLDKLKPVDYLRFVRNAYKYRQEGRTTIRTEDDREATKKAVRDAAGEDYRKWVDSLFKGVEEKSGIRNNVDYFTNSGNRRSWEALHWENNLENVIKVMKSQNDVGSAAIFTGHGIWGVSAKNYGSIEEIKADADRLKQLPEEEYNKIKESFGERLHEIAYSIMSKSERNPFIAEDNAMECIIDAVRKSKTKSGILKNLKEYQQLTVTETTVDDIISLVNDISNMPTEYFEAKPQRAVELNEIATAIIPDSTSESTKARLDDIGIKYLEYESGNEDARLEALNSLEDMRFSLAKDSYAPIFYSQMGKTIDEMKQDKIGANSVISYLKGRGVKDEEIKWSGIETFLDGKKSVTKAELQEFVANNQLQIEETVLSDGEAITIKQSSYEPNDLVIMHGGTVHDTLSWDEKEKVWVSDASGYYFISKENIRNYYKVNDNGTRWGDYKLDGGENYREITFKMPESDYTNQAMKAHWGENAKGILAHARIQDFDVDGKKMLFIEEIQSDWHNMGHKKGYVDKVTTPDLSNYEIRKLGVSPMSKYDFVWGLFDKSSGLRVFSAIRATEQEAWNELTDSLIKEEKRSQVPDAPYRNNYHEYVLKNIIRMAAEQGYDSIGWTPADIQSKRWSDEYAEGYRIEYDQDIPKFLNKYGKKWGAKVGTSNVNGNEVWTMPITDSMKDSVLYEGQARYSLATDGIPDIDDLWEFAKTKYGTIPKGEIPARDVDVPKKISKKDVVSRFARTMMEAGVTPDETVSEFEKAILDGTMTHEVITNKNARERAEHLIKHLGFEDALKQWSVLSDSGKVGKNELALGMELYNQCITNKDVHNAMKIAAELVAEATRAGQTLQATRMLKRMTPDGQLYYLEKSIQKMNEEFKEKLGDKYKDIELDEDLMEEFLTEKDETKRNEIYDKICQNIADQIPATKLDKWNSWRYLSMLGNLRTHLRNIFGNAVFIPSLKLKNYIGAVAEKTARVNTSDRTKSLRKSKEAVEFAKKDVEEMIKVLQGENAKYAVTSDIQGKRTIFKTRWLEKLRLKNFDFLEREDMWFLKYHYTDALARLITARNINVNSITPQMLEQLRAYAVKEAQAATYRDANALAEGLNRLQKNLEHSDKKSIRASGILLEGVMPFKKTPLNIAKQGVFYSPIGIIKGTYKALTKLKTGETTVTDVIDDLSKGLSGTMVMMLGYFLASMGWLGGDEDKSKKEKEFDKMVGEQSYALNIGDIFSYTIDWMTPSNLSLFIGAKLHDLTKDDFEFADVVGALSTVTEPLLELSVFSGLNGVIESAQYSDSEALLAIGSDMITSYLMQGLPTIGGQISRIVDGSKREYYYTDKNSVLPQGLQRLIGQASSKIPFASYLFQPAIDEWGREEKYGNIVERVLENTVSPGYYSAKNYTDVDKELKELHERTGDDSVLPVIQQKKYTEDSVNYYMRAEDYTETKKIRGQKSFELVNELLSNQKSVKLQNTKTKKYQNKRYSQMSDDEKVRAIQKCYEEAGDYTKEQMLEKVKSKSK